MAGQTYNETGIDHTVAWLLLGLVTTAFFFLTVLGMQNMQNTAKSIAVEPQQEQVAQPVYDLATER